MSAHDDKCDNFRRVFGEIAARSVGRLPAKLQWCCWDMCRGCIEAAFGVKKRKQGVTSIGVDLITFTLASVSYVGVAF